MHVCLAGDISERYQLPKRSETKSYSSRNSTKEDPTEIAQSHSEDDEGISPHVFVEKTPQAVHAEETRRQHHEGLIPR